MPRCPKKLRCSWTATVKSPKIDLQPTSWEPEKWLQEGNSLLADVETHLRQSRRGTLSGRLQEKIDVFLAGIDFKRCRDEVNKHCRHSTLSAKSLLIEVLDVADRLNEFVMLAGEHWRYYHGVQITHHSSTTRRR